ncbi:capsular biosynthesis protein [Tropicimonas marinistellae]|uniref:capsular biosynthesis protein n=1 Tax=Tropicimonas marinistellae TaxID=1739787 RepID=UPI00082CCAB0|nr:capsular biosynthesis protein [Tropicimonas marinistellae]
MKKIIIDLDNTIAGPKTTSYADCLPDHAVISRMRAYRDNGFCIVVFTARNMRTYDGEVGKINVHTLPTVIEWLDRHEVPYDEILVGKPWCGHEGFYVDDRAIRPDEFVRLSEAEIAALLSGPVSGNEASDKDGTPR